MWPFRKPAPREPDRKPPIEIGERFKYLGVDMVCSRHYAWMGMGVMNAVVAEYVTHLGEIKQITFFPVNWDALEAERVR